MVTVIQSARVFHDVVAMKQHMRGYMVSVHVPSVMALYDTETYCALWVYCRDQEAGGYFRKIFQLADILFLFLERCFSSSV